MEKSKESGSLVQDGDSQSEPQVLEPSSAFHEANLDRVQRRLSRNHVQMIAIAGVIGTGLFLGIGQILSVTGPLGMLLIFIHVSSTFYASLTSIAEMTAFAPITGSFPHFAERWVDPALGFAVGWNYCYNGMVSVPAEITASAAIIGFWDPNPHHTAIFVAVVCVFTLFVNLCGVRFFGHSEVVFATLKIMLVIGLIIGGLVVTAGGGPNHQSHGFEYWRNPGPMVSTFEPGARGRFVGLLVGIVPAVYAMVGTEVIAIASAETIQPRRNIASAMKTAFFRIVVFYILSVFILGLLVPSNDPKIFQKATNAGSSPFVIAFTRAGIKTLPSVINAAVLTSAFSAGNSGMYSTSRILYGLSVRRQAPKFMSKCTSSGLPYVAILISAAFTTLAFLTVSGHAAKVFGWLISISTVGGLIGQATINLTYLRFYYGLKTQGIKPEGIYRFKLQPYAAMWGLFWDVFYILVSGISVFWSFNGSDFVAAYINLPLFAILYVGYKVVKRSKIIPLKDLDFTTGIPSLEETEGGYSASRPSFLEKVKLTAQV